MKEMTVFYNPIQETYIYYEGKKKGPQKNRQEWRDVSEFITELRELIDPKRKSMLYIDSMPGDVFNKICDLFKNSKVDIGGLEKKL